MEYVRWDIETSGILYSFCSYSCGLYIPISYRGFWVIAILVRGDKAPSLKGGGLGMSYTYKMLFLSLKCYLVTSYWSDVTTGEVGSMVREAIKRGEAAINGRAHQNAE